MNSTHAQLDAALFVTGLVVAAVGGVAVLWFLLRDRARGRRRCPRCWYSMEGVHGLTCPECGKKIKREARLFRTRRRWRLALLGLVVMTLGVSGMMVPRVRKNGWLSPVPTALLLPFVPRADECRAYNAATKSSELVPIAKELLRRLGGDGIRDWEWEILLKQSKLVRSRERWPRGVPYEYEVIYPPWLPSGYRITTPNIGPWGLTASSSGAPLNIAHASLDTLDGAASSVEIKIVVERHWRVTPSKSKTPDPEWPITVGSATVKRRVVVAGDLEEVVAPAAGAEVDELVRQALIFEVHSSWTILRDYADPYPMLAIKVDRSKLKGYEDMGLNLAIELRRDGFLVREDMRCTTEDWVQSRSVPGTTDLLLIWDFRAIPVKEITDPELAKLWTVRVRGVGEGVLHQFERSRYWNGELRCNIGDMPNMGQFKTLRDRIR